jgi:lipoprotein-anchoring transpeptidase ErfK/SrfK
MDVSCRGWWRVLVTLTLLVGLFTAAALLLALPVAAEPDQPASPGLTIAATPASVEAGQAVSISVQLLVPNAPLTISRRIGAAQEFTVFAVVTADSAGLWTRSFAPSRTTVYRVEYAGDVAWAPAAADVTVPVRPRLRLEAAPSPVYEGQDVSLAARVRPAHPGGEVLLERCLDGEWTALQTLTLDDESRAVYVWRSEGRGKSTFRVSMAEDADHSAGLSPEASVKIRDANPYGVPVSAPRFLVADLSEYHLYYHEFGRIVRIFDCVLGKPSTPTPVGHFRIYAMDPQMGGPYGPRRMRYLGPYAIHGTNEPWLLSDFPRAYSHGCTRLSNANILWLFARCRVGTPVWNVR